MAPQIFVKPSLTCSLLLLGLRLYRLSQASRGYLIKPSGTSMAIVTAMIVSHLTGTNTGIFLIMHIVHATHPFHAMHCHTSIQVLQRDIGKTDDLTAVFCRKVGRFRFGFERGQRRAHGAGAF